MPLWENILNGRKMPDPEQIDIERLASLLDDPDEAVAISAMAELLNRENELGEIPGALQEHKNPLMRRRIHQLQSALTMIRRRRTLAELLQQEDFDFTSALIQLHLQWFDRDSENEICRKMRSFREKLMHYPALTLKDVGEAFAACAIIPCPVTTLKIEQYCLGSMLDDRCGATPLWCGMICREYSHLSLRTLCCQGRFVITDGKDLLIPENNWQLSPMPEGSQFEVWPPQALLYMAAMTLFSAAVNSDSFRYILTLAQAITGNESSTSLAALPYPYNPELESLS